MSVTTTGRLRSFVAKAMEELRAGELEIDKAHLIVKMSGRITESLYAEAKIQRLMMENGHDVLPLGSQQLGDVDDAAGKRAKAA